MNLRSKLTPAQLAKKFKVQADIAQHEDIVEKCFMAPARKIAEELANPPFLTRMKLKARGLTRIPADELTEEQKMALFLLAGYLKMDGATGKLVSIRPVAISDRGDGGYLIAIAPEGAAN